MEDQEGIKAMLAIEEHGQKFWPRALYKFFSK